MTEHFTGRPPEYLADLPTGSIPTANLHDLVIGLLNEEQRAALAQDLWNSVNADAFAAPFTPDQLEELDRRIASLDAGDSILIPWDDVRHELLGPR